MRSNKYIYFVITFFILIASAIAINNTLELKKSLFAPPVVDFTFNNNNTCSGQSISFTSTVTGDDPFEYAWDFGDGSTSTQPNPNHAFQAFGCGATQNFNVTLTVTDDNGFSTNISHTVTVKRKPDISFEDLDSEFGVPFENCNATAIEYTVSVGNTSSSNSCVTSYSVNWGDGNSESDVSFPILHTYVSLGSFNMVISAIGTNGCQSQVTYVVKNSSNPTGGIVTPGSTVDLCAPIVPLEFAISNWGLNPPDTIYDIDFGDGTTFILTQNELESSSYYNSSNPAASTDYPVPHAYTESNCPNSSYTVLLDIITSCGTSNLTAGPITILEKPEVSFDTENSTCVNENIQINNTSSSGYNPGCNTDANWFWDMGDGTTYNTFVPTHSYSASGTYTISLYAVNYCGETDPVTQLICVEAPLTPEYTVNNIEGCAPLMTVFNNTTNIVDQCGIPTFEWVINYTPSFCGTTNGANFINGTNANSETPEIEFTNPGTYEVILQGTNSCGITTSIPQDIFVKAPPQVEISEIIDFCGSSALVLPTAAVDGCGPDMVIYNWSLDIGVSPTDWEFINGTSPTSEFPEISFNTPNSYILSLEVSTSCGTNIDTEEFVISPVPTITNTDQNQTICSGADTMAINLISDITNTTYTWTSNNPSGLTGYLSSGTTDEIPIQTLINTTNAPITLTYTVIPQIGSCVGSPFTFDILVEPAPIITVQPLSDEVCLNGTTPVLTVDYEGSGTPIYQWYENTVDNTATGTAIPGATSQTYSPPTNTVVDVYYYIIITFSTGGCNEIISDTALIEVKEVSQIDEQPINTQSICVGGLAEELSVTVSGGAGTPTYQWYSNTTNSNTGGTLIPGATNSIYTPPVFTAIGTYYFYVEISYGANGCSNLLSSISEVIVVEDPVVDTQPIATQSLCQSTIPTDLEVIVSGGLGTISYQWYTNTTNSTIGGTAIAGETSSTFTPPTTGVGTFYYYCIITLDVSGCEVVSLVGEVEVTAAAQFTNQPLSDELCLGETTADLIVAYTNGAGSPSYQWYENTVSDVTSGTAIAGAITTTYSPDVSAVGTTYYYCIITLDAGGCSEIVSEVAEIIINETPYISDGTELICSGTLFEHIPDETNGDSVPTNTLYTWTTPIVTPAGSITGASEELIGQTSISQLLVNTTTNPGTLTYMVTPTSGNCVGADFEVIVTVNPSISVTSQVTNNNCFESNDASIEITIVGGVPFSVGNPYNISWTGPNAFTSTDEDLFNLAQGTYTLEIIDDGGCPFSETFIITEPDILEFSAVNFDPETISCFGADDGEIGIEVIGGTFPYTYNWTLNGSPFSVDEDLENLGPGEYVISVTDDRNCGPIIQTFTIVEPDVLDVTLDTKTDVLCFGDSTGAIAINVVGGRLDYEFAWTGPNAFTSINQNIDNLVAGIYNVTVTDDSNCTATLEVEIIQNTEITIDVTTTEIECYGDNDGSITINSISGGVGPYQVAWSNLGTGNSQNNLTGGTYTIIITDAENCTKEFPIIIEEPAVFLIDPVVTQMSCSGENDASIILNFVGGIAPVNLVWNDDPTAGTERNNLAPGTYTVTITDAAPCTIQESFTIFDIAPLLVSANVTNALDCDDTNSGGINLLIQGGSPPFDVVWSNGETTEDLQNSPPNNYTAQVTDANGCEATGSWTIERFEPLAVNVDIQSEVDCDAQTINQTFIAQATGGVPPFTFNWSSGTVSGVNNEQMTTEENGLIILDVVDSLGCSTSFSVNVDIPVFGDPDFEVNSIGFTNYGIFSIHDPIQFTNTSTGNFESVLWNFGDGTFSAEENPIHIYTAVGNYVVTQTVTYPFGCVYEQVVTLIVEEGYKLMFPDAFTPNEDSLNDFFVPKHMGLNDLEFRVYDTWGSLVFYEEDPESLIGWNGAINDELAENGNYYYTFSAKTFYGDAIEKDGVFVTIK